MRLDPEFYVTDLSCLSFQGLYPLKDYMQGLEASLEAVANRVQSLEEVVLLLRQTADLDPDPIIHRVRWEQAEGTSIAWFKTSYM